MQAGGLLKNPWPMIDTPALGVVGSVNHLPQPEMHHGGRAHGAGLEGDHQRTMRQRAPAKNRGGRTHGQDLRMSTGVLALLNLVSRLSDDSAFWANDNSPDGHLSL